MSESAETDESPDWEARIGELLDRLTRVQGELLAHLDIKRQALLTGDKDALVSSADREQVLAMQLEECQQQRQQLLQEASAAGLRGESVEQLAQQVVRKDRPGVVSAITEAQHRSRLLQHQSLANWVAVQRTLLHLSQMIEVIASGGRGQPTYEKKGHRASSGALVDQAV